MSQPKRKIAIVAKGGTSALAPWHDESWEIWGIPWISYPRCDVFFEMHEKGCINDASIAYDPYWASEEWVDKLDGKQIYCAPSRTYLPNSIEYPLEEIKKSIPFHYLENSISYMIALAIHEKVDVIGLWGVHMRGQYEYEAERPSITYLIGFAQGMGIEVYIPPGNPLMASVWEQGRYGVSNEKRLQHPCFTRS